MPDRPEFPPAVFPPCPTRTVPAVRLIVVGSPHCGRRGSQRLRDADAARVGSAVRDWVWRLASIDPLDLVTVTHGDGGLGALVHEWARRCALAEPDGHRADWFGPCGPDCDHGRRGRTDSGRTWCPWAGRRRDVDMLALRPQARLVLAVGLTYSPDLAHCLHHARVAGIPVRVA